MTDTTPATLDDTAIVPVQSTGLALFEQPAALERRLLAYSASRKALLAWVRDQLVAGVDYQLIHRKIGPRGSKQDCPNRGDTKSSTCFKCGGKATLCKPGAEKIAGLLQLRPAFSRDQETWEMIGGPTLKEHVICVRCDLVGPTGEIVAEGRGARAISADYGDVNKTIKMVQKSAQIDAVLRCAGLSELFTQDLEDQVEALERAAKPSVPLQPTVSESQPPPTIVVPADSLFGPEPPVLPDDPVDYGENGDLVTRADAAETEPHVPCCDDHGPMKWVPPGVSKRTNKPYDGFFGCVERSCKRSVSLLGDKDRRAMFASLHEHNRSEDEFRQWLADTYGWESTKQITSDVGADVMAWIEGR